MTINRILQYTHIHMCAYTCIHITMRIEITPGPSITHRHTHMEREADLHTYYLTWQKDLSLASELHQECFVGWLSGLIPLKEQARLVPSTSTGSAKWTNSINTLGLVGAQGHAKVVGCWYGWKNWLLKQKYTSFLFKVMQHALNSSCWGLLYKDKVWYPGNCHQVRKKITHWEE